jgi:hypothetical protein
MSPAGLNRVCEILTFSYPQDDSSGGAVPSGTVIYQNVNIRIEPIRPTMALLEQGLEVSTLYQAMIFAGNLEVKHNDQIHFTAPINDWFYDKKFRVIGLQRSSNHPAQDRNQIKLILRRFEESHLNSLQ